MEKILNLVNSNIASNLPAYSGVSTTEQLIRNEGTPAGLELVRLNANENPFGTHPAIHHALQNLPLHLYPDQNQENVRNALSDYVGFPQSMIVAGAGADELIDLLIRLFVEPGDRVLNFTPTFGMYEFCAKLAASDIVNLPRDSEWRADVDAAVTMVKTRECKTKIIFVASPNNPTGNILPEDDTASLLQTGAIVVIDETYAEFAGTTVTDLLHEYDNLVILRSLSKWAGIAGLRVGYAITSPEIVRMLMSIKQPYNISKPAEVGMIAALENKEVLMDRVKQLIVQRRRMEIAIDAMDGVDYWESFGNFLLCRFTRKSAGQIYEFLAENGIFVRRFPSELTRLKNTLRISVGNDGQTERLLRVLREANER